MLARVIEAKLLDIIGSDGRMLDSRVFAFERVTSTMDLARQMIAGGPAATEWASVQCRRVSRDQPCGDIFLALEQTNGRGTKGRTWVSRPGAGVYLSAARRLPIHLTDLQGISLAAGVAVREMLSGIGVEAALKWPNDIICRKVDGSWGKICGVLFESLPLSKSRDTGIVLGIGLNLSRLKDKDLPAVSVAELTGLNDAEGEWMYAEIAALTIATVDAFLREVSVGNLADYLSRWQLSAWGLGKRINFSSGERTVAGIFCGIGEQGELVLETATGIERYFSGELEFDYAAGN